MLSKRQEEILLYIVSEYIKTAQPIGSGFLTSRPGINVSSATIRNEMSVLEEMGFLSQIHVSSGRVPNDQAYRFYVDRLLSRKIPEPIIKEDILMMYSDKVIELEDLIEKTCKVLSEITNYTSLVLAPKIKKSILKYLKVAPVNEHCVMLIMLLNTGKVIHRLIDLHFNVEALDLNKITNLLNEKISGILSKPLPHIDFSCFIDNNHNEAVKDIIFNIESMIKDEENKLFYEGILKLINLPEFNNLNNLKKMLEVLKEEKMIAEILSNSMQEQGLKVYIGDENKMDIMKDFSFIASSYELSGEVIGGLGIIGPTRMPYIEIMSTVNYIARALSNKLSNII